MDNLKYQNNHNNFHHKKEYLSFWESLWDSFWNPPHETCPKCKSTNVEYYDPFFFAPIRTLKGHRRVKCKTCHFIWRPTRRRKSMGHFFGFFE
jgi:hypothetical protein